MGPRRYLARVVGGLLVAALASPAVAGQTDTLPQLTAPVNDLAGVIDPASAQELDRIIRILQAASGDVIIVATVPSIAPHGSIEEYAARLFERAGIGERGVHNGLLVLVAVQDRMTRIEVGYGLEEFITDGFAGETIRTHLLPAFRQERYGPGLVAGTRVLASRIADRRGVTLADVQVPARRSRDIEGGLRVGGLTLLFVILVVAAIIRGLSGGGRGGPTHFNRRHGQGTWSGWHGGVGGFGGGFGGGSRGGFGGGSFGGFGGGRSGGGGASGRW